MHIINNIKVTEKEKYLKLLEGELSYLVSPSSYLSTNDIRDIEEMISYVSGFEYLVVVGEGVKGVKAIHNALNLKSNLLFIEDFSVSTYKETFDFLKGKNYAVNIISVDSSEETKGIYKAVSKLLALNFEEFEDRIIVTSTKDSYLLDKKHRVLQIPSRIPHTDIIFTNAFIFPLAFAGFNYQSFMKGFESAIGLVEGAIDYAYLLSKNKMHSLTSYEAKLKPIINYLASNFGFVGTVNGKINSETIVKLDPSEYLYLDELNIFFSEINDKIAFNHFNNKDENSVLIEIDKLDEFNLGEFIHFMLISYNFYFLDK